VLSTQACSAWVFVTAHWSAGPVVRNRERGRLRRLRVTTRGAERKSAEHERARRRLGGDSAAKAPLVASFGRRDPRSSQGAVLRLSR